jgi:Tol biopolymer transport system component/tRNA A-37 threonylcarbamoyl transferase component Bud32
MELKPGQKLGPYEIVAVIGRGGMGELWKARDPRLNRDVAIKTSQMEFSGRFQREAQAVAALNHPNICTMYDVGPNYLVMEYIEGATLAERIAQGPVPLDEALAIAKQIADALEAAHEKGIVHRDLKPANIKIRPDGSVKVLNFGLAKSGDAQEVTADSPTMMPGTLAGMILGTAGYMSPEQARGQAVDKRADIWAFGVVLYETLTAKRLFDGPTVTDSLAAILTLEPDLTPVPERARRLLTRCLEKDPKKRLRDIGDAWALLDTESATAAPSRSRLGMTGWIAAAALFAVSTAALAFVHFREKPPVARVLNVTLLPPDGAEFDFGAPIAMPALSPDGTRIVFGARPKDGRTQLYVRRLDSNTPQPLPGTEGAGFPFWSPDGRWVGFGQGSKLKKIDTQGGPAITVTDVPEGSFRGGSWSPRGVIIFGTNTGASILRVAVAGAKAAPATGVEPRTQSGGEGNPLYPWFLPDGRHFLYTSRQSGDIPVRVGSLDEPGKPGKVVAQAHSDAVYAQGHLLYLRENTLMAQPFDPNELETTGEAVPVAEGVPTFVAPSRCAAFTVSAGGLLAYQSGADRSRSRLVWKDRQGKTLGTLGDSPYGIVTLALAPDGKRLAAAIRDGVLSVNANIWIYDTVRGIPTRFTFGATGDRAPVWSPDGNTIYFGSLRAGSVDLFRKPSNGAATEELLLNDPKAKSPDSVSPDGQLLLYHSSSGKSDLWLLPLAPARSGGKPEPRVFLQTQFDEGWGRFSPDGRWVAYESTESGQSEIYVAPFPGPGGKRQISSGGGRYSTWRRDGRELFYITRDGELMAAELSENNGTLEIGRVQKLFDGVSSSAYSYAVTADGQKFVVVENTAAATPRPLTLLENWTAALRK